MSEQRTTRARRSVPWRLMLLCAALCAGGVALDAAALGAERFWFAGARGSFVAVGAAGGLALVGVAWLMRAVLARREPE